MKAISSLILIIITCTVLNAQQSVQPKPLVSEKFDKLFLSENFDSSNTYWTTVSNTENLLLVQDGEYILNRKATVSPFAAMGGFKNTLNAFRLVTSLKIEKTVADDGSIGLIFMAQPGGQGGFVFEINKNQQYRLRQIASGTYHYLTGNQKDGGWTKSSLVKGLNIPNLVELRVADKNYDIYINNSLLLSFTEIAYKSGDFGFIIGPGSKGKVDFLYLFTNQKGVENPEDLQEKMQTLNPENDVMALAESIITLKTQINKVNEENEDLKQLISSLKAAEKESDEKEAQTAKSIQALQQQIKKSQNSYDSLLKINTDLLRYKEMVAGNDGGDLVISLSRNLKAEKLKSEELLKTNQALRDSVAALQNANKNKSTKQNPPPVSPSKDSINGEKNKSKTDFSLPKEN